MSDTNLEQTDSTQPSDSGATEPVQVRVAEISTLAAATVPAPSAGTRSVAATPTSPAQHSDRSGKVEHLAARRPVAPLDAEDPEVKQRLSALRTELTTLVTDLRWGGVSVQDTADQVIPLLNVGPVQQWAAPLVATILEIDRAGNLTPVWLKVIEQDDTLDLPPHANPAETMIGRARRFALLMLGNYKAPEISDALGKLASDPNSSLYATQSLAKQATTPAMQALISALKDAEGWAKVDIVEACATLNQPRFHEILLASGLDHAAGLESYIAVALYRTIKLERYLRGGSNIAPRLVEQTVLVVSQVLQDSMSTPGVGVLPVIFERDLPTLGEALFAGARSAPNWRKVVAVHRLALFLGRSWADISRGVIQDPQITQPIYGCLPMMPEIERWMNGPAREVLLETLTSTNEEAITPAVKVLGDLQEPRAIAAFIARLDATAHLADRVQALQLGTICDTLGRLGDRRAVGSLQQLVERVANPTARAARLKRRDNLELGDPDIPASIVYAAVVRALGQLSERSTLDLIIRAAGDFDPYVRAQAFEALKRIDPAGDEPRSRIVVREALHDPRDTVVHVACQLTAQYRDTEAAPILRELLETRPNFAASARDALRQLGLMAV